ncbi:MAG: Cof-type HAD-IIB family hydrolase [Treponema sp.]|nr:Cof-type HAD-IIB family hydrolase [Treponema sp.]
MKIIFLDIDGTFLDFSGIIPESARQAVLAARKAGNKVYINTGRPKSELYDNIKNVGWDGYICSNSLYIEDKGIVLRYESMDSELVREVCEWMNERSIGFFLEAQTDIFPNEFFISESIRMLGNESVELFKKSFPNMLVNKPLVYDGIAKINVVNRKEWLHALRERFGKRLQIDVWSRSGAVDEMAEITVPGASKAIGCRLILERLGIPVKDSFAFGDTGGDASMLSFCGTGIAMGNASDEAKSAADHVTDAVLEDGLAHAFKKFNLV